ncbi:MAG: hypothetical protein VZR27_09050 [Acutalibacteraceae bacterium]|nr:hypothetical protein [Acutalibacteraceae bacterium]
MSIKKFTALILSVLMVCSMAVLPVSAEEISDVSANIDVDYVVEDLPDNSGFKVTMNEDIPEDTNSEVAFEEEVPENKDEVTLEDNEPAPKIIPQVSGEVEEDVRIPAF